MVLVPRPNCDQRRVDTEILVTQQIPLPRQSQHFLEEGRRDLALQQHLPVLRQYGRIPDRITHV
jgi:hypothetical protein